MSVNEQAINAVKQRWTWKSMHWPDLDSDQITAALEAAMPHIRKQIAEEIRNHPECSWHGLADGMENAADIVEGKA